MHDITLLLTVFILACFIGYFIIWRVTPALYSPLMSVSNAISGIIIIGAITVCGHHYSFIGLLAVALAAINIFGGFAVSQRMLQMFKKKNNRKENEK